MKNLLNWNGVKPVLSTFNAYVIEEISREAGHCNLNPTELVRSQFKINVASNNKLFKLSEVHSLLA
ncbi:hypothetical protein PR048_021622 [Dryococelus australis]|uniref:Uncharacterized protein n=1 Tax=Dryococelus australis TaxID=614101 RepID=A0ABQ9GYT5_9NEOP|nr:hypothetical protein PR048_021622 [Dryococelus australis]